LYIHHCWHTVKRLTLYPQFISSQFVTFAVLFVNRDEASHHCFNAFSVISVIFVVVNLKPLFTHMYSIADQILCTWWENERVRTEM